MYDYQALKKQELDELEMLENNEVIQAVINHTLHNKSEVTDYDAWVEGAKTAARNNYVQLREWIS